MLSKHTPGGKEHDQHHHAGQRVTLEVSPQAKSMLAELGLDPAQTYTGGLDKLRQVFGPLNIKIKVTKSTNSRTKETILEIGGEINPESGNIPGGVFAFSHTISNKPDGKLVARYELAKVHEKAQDTGFGTESYFRLEDEYRKIGIDQIELHANMSVGGYAWAVMGFDFKNPVQRKAIVDSCADETVIFNNVFSEYRRRNGGKRPNTQQIEAESAQIAEAFRRCEHAYQLAAVTCVLPDGSEYRIGKQFMRADHWDGVKYLKGPLAEQQAQIGNAYRARKNQKKQS